MNYSSGESVGGSWTDKVLSVKDEKEKGSHLSTDSEAVNDDEWVCFFCVITFLVVEYHVSYFKHYIVYLKLVRHFIEDAV